MDAPQPVTIEVVRGCAFVAKPCATCGNQKANRIHRKKNQQEGLPYCPFRRQNGCAACGRNKGDRVHFGEPPSLNFFSFSAKTGPMLSAAKQQWQAIFLDLLRETDLPLGLGRVYVSGTATFPTDSRTRDGDYNRDQGNFRVLPEKALGDALEEGGYLQSDGWDRYEFGDFGQRVVPGVSSTRLTIMPLPAINPNPQQELAV